MGQEIVIRSEVDRRNDSICRFTVDKTLCVGSVSFTRKGETQGAPLAKKLFEIDGVAKVSMIGHLLIITKTVNGDWREIGPSVEAVLSAYLTSGLALTSEQVFDRMQLIGRDPREKIQYLLDHQINPGVSAHAGFVELVNVEDGIVYLRMGGGCQGCGAADFTLKAGIEAIIRQEVPEVRQIIDVTDHAAGMSPYFRPGKASSF